MLISERVALGKRLIRNGWMEIFAVANWLLFFWWGRGGANLDSNQVAKESTRRQ